MTRLLRDLSLSAVVAGFIAVLVGVTSSVPIAFEAARAVGATPGQAGSWVWALGIGTGITSVGLSLAYRRPVLTAWSTSGAALIAGTSGIQYAEAIGAFAVCGVLITLAGATGLFARVMDRIPMALASALLAGVLARFALEAFTSVEAEPALLIAMFLALLVGRRSWPRYAVPGVLAVGMAVAALQGDLHLGAVEWSLARPELTTPSFTAGAIIGLALPLFVITMASQNLPGMAAQRAAGYDLAVSPVVTTTGAMTVILAPFGAFSFNLAAITAAICLGKEAHPDPARRYIAPVSAGLLYIVIGVFGGAITGLLIAFPRALVVSVAGLALLATIGGGLGTALKDDRNRDAAIITFLVALSGLELLGVGAPFWAVVAGAITLVIERWRLRA